MVYIVGTKIQMAYIYRDERPI